MIDLLERAEREGLLGSMERSKRYFRLARSIGMRTKTPFPKGIPYCRKCQSLLLPGINGRVRLRAGKVIFHCLECHSIRRYPYLREKRGGADAEADEKRA